MDSTAKMVGTVGVWFSVAIIMAGGICRMNFSGDLALPAFLLTIAMLCGAATVSTGLIWRNRPLPLPAVHSGAAPMALE